MTEILQLLFLGIGSFYDIKTRELPERFLFVSAALASVYSFFWAKLPFGEILGGLMLGGGFLLLGRLTNEAVGYGDGVGIIVLGMMKGGSRTLLLLLAALFLSALAGGAKILCGKGKFSDILPFYPFLFAAALGGVFV